jgi:hypothetical protein
MSGKSIKWLKWTSEDVFLNNEIINIVLYSMKKKLAAKNIYIINLTDTTTYIKTFKLLADKYKLIFILDYLLFYNNEIILLFMACKNLH